MRPNPPKMTPQQARTFWNALTPQQKADFNKMFGKLVNGDLKLKDILVDDQELIQTVILEDKEAPSMPSAPFGKHFQLEKKD